MHLSPYTPFVTLPEYYNSITGKAHINKTTDSKTSPRCVYLYFRYCHLENTRRANDVGLEWITFDQVLLGSRTTDKRGYRTKVERKRAQDGTLVKILQSRWPALSLVIISITIPLISLSLFLFPMKKR